MKCIQVSGLRAPRCSWCIARTAPDLWAADRGAIVARKQPAPKQPVPKTASPSAAHTAAHHHAARGGFTTVAVARGTLTINGTARCHRLCIYTCA